MEGNTSAQGFESLRISDSDIIIAVLGITGSGKSTFIQTLTHVDTGIGNSLASETTQIGIYSYYEESGRRVYLVDTPGFDEAVRSDVDVLEEQIFFFSQLFRAGAPLVGLVYMHSISKNRIGGSSVKNFRMLEQMCGPHALDRVVLLTTMWDQIEPGHAQQTLALQRHRELTKDKQFWGNMVCHGSRVMQFDGGKPSAQRVIEALATKYAQDGPVVLQIQREIVVEKKDTWNTSASREVARDLVRIKGDAKRELANLEKVERQPRSGAASLIAEEKAALEQKVQNVAEAERRLLTRFEDISYQKEARFAQLMDERNREYQSLLQQLQHAELKIERLEQERQESTAIYESYQSEQYETQSYYSRSSYDESFRSSYEQDQQLIRKSQTELDKGVKAKKRKKLLIQNIVPMLQILGGIGCVAGGAATMAIPIAAVGATMITSGASGLRFSTKDKEKPTPVESADTDTS
ncbi:hypothetical protein PFICI_12695 [Pestalotiopsis fici W106-1]|uniref:G domain-containing protein n=1 Tax=Pestalotiopsis fici (strain W106-1 / CGMCC3.15140) TaxID=1229662 RepID=W3WSF1_PESFW|nr:uncharacterized protein PFICI_12695 [Pestalotiopsis fici W106-1]ETS75751.1 hypothetical protein PFICI_12695 [Pestalotiopsis fici W106-1]